MPYSQFTTLRKAIDAFGLQLQEGQFFPEVEPIAPSSALVEQLTEGLPIVAAGSEKARSEGIIYPVLLEVRRVLGRQISFFSGEDFTVDETVGLNGIVDFLISKSPIVSTIEAPVAVIVEAKKADISTGLGQRAAEMVASWRFNHAHQLPVSKVYGSVSNGTQWRFLQLAGSTLTIDLRDYPLPPADHVLSLLVWMMQQS